MATLSRDGRFYADGTMPGMASRFTLRTLFISTALIAAGCGASAYVIRFRYDQTGHTDPAIALAIYFLVGPFVGAGIFNLFDRASRGAVIGFAIQAVLTITMMQLEKG